MVTRVDVTTGNPGGGAFSPTLPTHQAGDRLTLHVVGKYNTTTIPTIDQGWTLVKSGTGGTGTTGNDVGTTFWAVYAKDATSSSETAPTVTPGATVPNSWEWVCASHRPGAGKQWRDAIAASVAWVQSASDTSTSSPLTGTCGAWTGVQPTGGDAIFATGNVPTDLGSALGTTIMTATGLSGGTKSTATTQYVENSLGNDSAAVWVGWTGFTGTATAGLALQLTITGASNQSGTVVGVALREETAVTEHFADVTLAGTGTLTAGAVLLPALVAATLAGTGTLTAAATRTALGTATLAGTGTITAAAETSAPVTEIEATLAGTGTLTAGVVLEARAAAVLAGTGTITAAAVRTAFGVATLAGTGTITAAAVRAAFGVATLAGAGTIAAAVGLVLAAAATLAGTGTITAAAVVGSVAILAGTGTITAAVLVARFAAATLAGVGTITATARATLLAAATLAGVGTITAAALVVRLVTATLAGVGTITAATLIVQVIVATLAGVGTILASAQAGISEPDPYPLLTTHRVRVFAGASTERPGGIYRERT